jgi:hypothetical protein
MQPCVTLGAADFHRNQIIPTGTTYSWPLPVATGIIMVLLRVQMRLRLRQEH